jgi:hypothetical protein
MGACAVKGERQVSATHTGFFKKVKIKNKYQGNMRNINTKFDFFLSMFEYIDTTLGRSVKMYLSDVNIITFLSKFSG